MKNRVTIHRIEAEQIQRIAEDIYIYGYPLLVTDVMRLTHTAAAYPTARTAPANQFAHGRLPHGSHDKGSVQPDADCLRSTAWLHLNREPVVFTIPRIQRYHLFTCLSGWYEIFETFSPRTKGTQGGQFGIVGPHWSGKLPAGVKRISAPTETVWLDGCFAVAAAEDTRFVHGEQEQFRLTPLSQWGIPAMPHSLPYRLDVDQKASPQEQVDRFDAREFFTRLSRLLQRNPAQGCDGEIVADFVRIGFFPGEEFVFEMLPPDTIGAMHAAVPAAQSKLINAAKEAGRRKTINNWSHYTHPGFYEANYLDRAVAAYSSVPGVLAEDLVCFQTAMDQTGEPLKGTNRYVINFSRQLLPPVNAFWSVTLYDSRQRLVPNDIHRYVIGDLDRLRLNPDQSLSLHIQHEWPGTGRDSNWLPAPKDAFNLAFRMYWPKSDVFTGAWRPPAVIRTN